MKDGSIEDQQRVISHAILFQLTNSTEMRKAFFLLLLFFIRNFRRNDLEQRNYEENTVMISLTMKISLTDDSIVIDKIDIEWKEEHSNKKSIKNELVTLNNSETMMSSDSKQIKVKNHSKRSRFQIFHFYFLKIIKNLLEFLYKTSNVKETTSFSFHLNSFIFNCDI